MSQFLSNYYQPKKQCYDGDMHSKVEKEFNVFFNEEDLKLFSAIRITSSNGH